jgi:hypothetical protein
MVEDDDFDTKVASSRVDTIIRLADSEAAQVNRVTPHGVEPVVATEGEENDEEADNSYVDPNDIPMEVYAGGEEQLYSQTDEFNDDALNEDVDTSEDNEDISYPEIKENYPLETEYVAEPVMEEENDDNDGFDGFDALNEEEQAARKKMIVRRTLQVVGIILAVVALIFIVKFIMNNWQTVLITIGIAIVVAILIVWLKRKR